MGKGQPFFSLKRFASDLRPENSERLLQASFIRLVGFSLYWTWIWAFFITDMSGTHGVSHSLLPSSVAELTTRALALAVAAIVARRTAPCRFVKNAATTSIVLGPLGVIALALVQTLGGLETAGGLAVWAPIGVADALLVIAWLDLYRFDGLRSAVLSVCLASLVAVLVLALVTVLSGPVAVAAVAALPALSGGALLWARASAAPGMRAAQEGPSPAPVRELVSVGAVFAIIAAYSLAFGTMQVLTYTDSAVSISFDLRILALSLGALLSLAVSLSPMSNTDTIFRVALPVFAFGLLIAPIMGNSTALAGALIIVGFRLFDVLSITILLRLSALHDLPPTTTFCVGRFANTLGHLGGWVAVSALAGFTTFDGATLEAASSALLFILIVTSGALLRGEGSLLGGRDLEQANANLEQEHRAAAIGRWRRQCQLVSTQYGLSPRETEVLELLAKGRDAAYISTLFVISPHTAKTHIHNVYKKLGIHSQQELIDIVEDAAAYLKDASSGLPAGGLQSLTPRS